MSMQHWPRELAQRLGAQVGWQHPLQTMPDHAIKPYLQQMLATIPIQDFLAGVALPTAEDDDAAPSPLADELLDDDEVVE